MLADCVTIVLEFDTSLSASPYGIFNLCPYGLFYLPILHFQLYELYNFITFYSTTTLAARITFSPILYPLVKTFLILFLYL